VLTSFVVGVEKIIDGMFGVEVPNLDLTNTCAYTHTRPNPKLVRRSKKFRGMSSTRLHDVNLNDGKGVATLGGIRRHVSCLHEERVAQFRKRSFEEENVTVLWVDFEGALLLARTLPFCYLVDDLPVPRRLNVKVFRPNLY
jgi:hypothetical protein